MCHSIDLEMRIISECQVDYFRDKTEGIKDHVEEARRNQRILEILMTSPDTQTKLALQEPFFRMLCNSLVERAKTA